MASLPIRAYRNVTRRIRENRRRRYAADILGQQIPLQSLCRTVFDHDVHWFGEREFYDPPDRLASGAGELKLLGLQSVPQALPRPYYFHVENAVISGRDAIDPARPHRAILELYPEVTIPREGKTWYFNPPERVSTVRAAEGLAPSFQEAFIFSDITWNSLYHFLMDSCLRFVELERSGALSPDTTILYYEAPNRWQRAYLDLLGLPVSPDRILPSEPERLVKVGRLIVASPRRSRFVCSKGSIVRLRDRLFDRLGLQGGCPGDRRILISRADAANRRILNEAEVRDYLEGRGFETVTLGTMPVADQIRLFSEAETIVAPHGAGLANMIYATRPKIVELLPTDGWRLGYFLCLANHLGFEHVPIASAAAAPGDPLGYAEKDADFAVDLARLRQVV